MRAMILAAGRGERMRPLTDDVPKPLLPVAGRPLIEHQLVALSRAGIREVVINLAWRGALLREALGDGARFGVRIEYSDEAGAALETGGGIFQALPLLGAGPFLVVSGDIWSDFPFASSTSRPAHEDIAHFVLVPNPEFHERGDFGLEGGRVTDVPGPGHLKGQKLTYANIGVYRPEFFAGCKPGRFPLAPLMFAWARKGRVSGELYTGGWFNIGTPAQLGELDARLRARERPGS